MEISRYTQPPAVKPAAAEKKTVKEEMPQKQPKETYSPSEKPAVKEMSAAEQAQHIEKLRQDSEKHFESLKNLVAKMLEKQGYTFQDLTYFSQKSPSSKIRQNFRWEMNGSFLSLL